jgi:DNA polymerase III epsilon subunit family exonuclease
MDVTSGLLGGKRLMAIDLETTGFGLAEGHGVIEVARVTIDDGALGDDWTTLVRPRRPVSDGSREVHGISDGMLREAPEPQQVAEALVAACDDLPLVVHNAPFDIQFLARLFEDAGREPLVNPVIDTLGLARGMFGSGNNALATLRLALGLPEEREHRALGDARTAARTLLALAPRWEVERGVRSIAELAAASQDVLRLSMRRGPDAPALERRFIA